MAVDILTEDRRIFIMKGLPVDYLEFKHFIIVSYEWFKNKLMEGE